MGWYSITIWECELKPNKREETLESLAFTLNRIYLKDWTIKQYEMTEEKPMIAAEEMAEAVGPVSTPSSTDKTIH